MEQNSDNAQSTPKIKFKPIIEAARELCSFVDGRRNGKIRSLKTPWKKFNEACMGGIDYHNIYTIAGMSGSGKTSMISQLETGLKDLNPHEDFSILSFNWEMLSQRLIGRKISNKLQLTVSQLYSGDKSFKVTDDVYDKVVEECKNLAKYDITYYELPSNVEKLEIIIDEFVRQKKIDNPYKGFIVFLDHALLVNGKDGESERRTLFEFMALLNVLKRRYKMSFVLLSQLNRDIEDKVRITEPTLHFPQKSDLFGSDGIYQFSDVVIVSHRPEILNIAQYGPQRWPTEGIIYHHYLKMREGQPFIAKMKNNLKHNEVTDWNDSETRKE